VSEGPTAEFESMCERLEAPDLLRRAHVAGSEVGAAVTPN